MKIIAKNTTELCNTIYGDNEDYDYIKEKDIPELINNYVEYLEDIREDENFCDNGYIGDIINLLDLFKNIELEVKEEYLDMKNTIRYDIDYYGEDENYIHAKFGDLVKRYNFTEDFMEKYKEFADNYIKYWDGDETSIFKEPLDIVHYVIDNNIPVYAYLNYYDEPTSWGELLDYFKGGK